MSGNPTGKKVRCPQGYDAFLPNPLPPNIEWTQTLIEALSEADRSIGRLAGEGGHLPNPHLLIRPFIRREAVLSSRIEGTQATLGEILAAEAEAHVNRSPADLREVANYVVALEYGVKRLKDLPLSLRLIREIHEKLMKGVRGETSTPGEFRHSQNWIGRPGCLLNEARYVPPPPSELMNCLGEFEKFLHGPFKPPLIQVALAHYQFEAIHPFLDGNGRVGRLLITLFLVEHKILPSPLLYLSAYFESTRDQYYAHLRAITEEGNWQRWLEYFLQGVAHQAEDAISRSERINKKLVQWRKLVAGASTKTPMLVIDLLAANPFLTVKKVAKELGIAFTTAQRAIEKLEKISIIKEVTQAKRDRTYCAKVILDILDEPAQHLRQ
ncbi:MAG: Fic family protein [Deltaproteobacteria bacterium]|nr:Fic family protein [Deltaproteobacteria bacterium]